MVNESWAGSQHPDDQDQLRTNAKLWRKYIKDFCGKKKVWVPR